MQKVDNDIFKRMQELGELMQPKYAPDGDSQQDEDAFYKSHRGRITGSIYDRALSISKTEVRHPNEATGGRVNKGEKLQFIKDRGLQSELDRAEKENGKLTLSIIDPIYYSIVPTVMRKLNKTAQKELITLIAELDLKGRNRAKMWDSAATRHGKETEPKALDVFEKWYKKNVATDVVFDRPTELITHPDNPIWGSTPDMTIRKNYQTYVTEICEMKSPHNPMYHFKKIVEPTYMELIGETSKNWIADTRYEKQNLGYFHNIPTVETVYFASFEPMAKTKPLFVQVLRREDLQDEISEFAQDLAWFTDLYAEIAKKELGIDVLDLDYWAE